MISNEKDNIYYQNLNMSNNKLFATFVQKDNLDETIDNLTNSYSILYQKIFVLDMYDSDEYLITYNIEQNNISKIPYNTISLHRKKEFNVLYSINSLNALIKTLNGGEIDKNYNINWDNYRNGVLLTQNGDFKYVKTQIYKIINL